MDPLGIIERLRREPELGFLYLTPREDFRSSRYNPYNLRVTVHSKVNKSDYSTLSLHGVTRMIAGREPEFTDLEQWVCDLSHFNQLVKISTFAKFRTWKAFSTWRENVRSRYIHVQCTLYIHIIYILPRIYTVITMYMYIVRTCMHMYIHFTYMYMCTNVHIICTCTYYDTLHVHA